MANRKLFNCIFTPLDSGVGTVLEYSMVEFLVEVYTGDRWIPSAIWSDLKSIRQALKRMQDICERDGLEKDAHRIKPLRTTDAKIQAHTQLAEHKRGL